MGRITSFITVTNPLNPEKSITFDALVDTRASHLTLPTAWKDKLGELTSLGEVDVELAKLGAMKGEICGPIQAQIEGFRPIFSEVLFVEMEPRNRRYEPLIGYLVLEASQAAVDTLGHRLVKVKYLDLKAGRCDALVGSL